MVIARNPFPSGIGKEIARSVEGPTGLQKTSSAQIMGPPKEVGWFVTEAGVEAAMQLPKH